MLPSQTGRPVQAGSLGRRSGGTGTGTGAGAGAGAGASAATAGSRVRRDSR